MAPAESLGCVECDEAYRSARQLRAHLEQAFPDGVPMDDPLGMAATESLGQLLTLKCQTCGVALEERPGLLEHG